MVGLDKLTGRILSDAEEFARGLLESAKAEAAEISKAAEGKIDSIKNDYASRAEKEEKVIIDRAHASADSLSRDIILAAKNSLLDSVFAEAKERLVRLAESGSDEYINFLAKLLCKVGISAAESERTDVSGSDLFSESTELVALFCARDLAGGVASVAEKAVSKAAPELASTGKPLSVSDKPANIEGGFILRCGNIEYNCSLSALVAGCRASLESEIYCALFAQCDKT